MANLIALQMTSTPNVDDNLETVANAMATANIENDSLVVLPECFAYFGGKDKGQLSVAEKRATGPFNLVYHNWRSNITVTLYRVPFRSQPTIPTNFRPLVCCLGPTENVLQTIVKSTCLMCQ